MFCRKCGAELKENAKFCTKCGSKVENQKYSKAKTKEKGIGVVIAVIAGCIAISLAVCAVFYLSFRQDRTEDTKIQQVEEAEVVEEDTKEQQEKETEADNGRRRKKSRLQKRQYALSQTPSWPDTERIY